MSADKPYQLKVQELAKSGITLSDISKYLVLSEDDLVRDYADVYYKAIIDRNIEVAETVYRIALEGNLTACQFWLKNLGKWEDYSKAAPRITDDKIYDEIKINIISKQEDVNNGEE